MVKQKFKVWLNPGLHNFFAKNIKIYLTRVLPHQQVPLLNIIVTEIEIRIRLFGESP